MWCESQRKMIHANNHAMFNKRMNQLKASHSDNKYEACFAAKKALRTKQQW